MLRRGGRRSGDFLRRVLSCRSAGRIGNFVTGRELPAGVDRRAEFIDRRRAGAGVAAAARMGRLKMCPINRSMEINMKRLLSYAAAIAATGFASAYAAAPDAVVKAAEACCAAMAACCVGGGCC